MVFQGLEPLQGKYSIGSSRGHENSLGATENIILTYGNILHFVNNWLVVMVDSSCQDIWFIEILQVKN